jgi:hypothetical protein
MQLPAINPNTIIIAVLVVAGLYGLFGGKQRLRLLILSVYVGIVLAEQMSSIVGPYAHPLGPDQISLMLLGLPIIIFGFARFKSSKSDKGAMIGNILVGLLTGALIVASALRLMPTSEMAAIDGDSFIAMELQQYQLWLVGLLPLAAVLFGLMKGEKKHH